MDFPYLTTQNSVCQVYLEDRPEHVHLPVGAESHLLMNAALESFDYGFLEAVSRAIELTSQQPRGATNWSQWWGALSKSLALQMKRVFFYHRSRKLLHASQTVA